MDELYKFWFENQFIKVEPLFRISFKNTFVNCIIFLNVYSIPSNNGSKKWLQFCKFPISGVNDIGENLEFNLKFLPMQKYSDFSRK